MRRSRSKQLTSTVTNDMHERISSHEIAMARLGDSPQDSASGSSGAVDKAKSQITLYHAIDGGGHVRANQAKSDQVQNASRRSKGGWRGQLVRWTTDNWVWEFGSWTFSTILLMGVALTLLVHDNQPLPDWPLGITIYALISLLSTFATSALIVVVTSIIGQGRWFQFAAKQHRLSDFEMYDEASRGPLG